MVNLKAGHVIRGGHDSNSTASSSSVDHSNATTKHATGSNILETRASSYWLPSLAPEGAVSTYLLLRRLHAHRYTYSYLGTPCDSVWLPVLPQRGD